MKYFRGDELPAWELAITLNGEVEDFSTGWDFTVTLSRKDADTITKTGGIGGTAPGVVQVQWDPGELDIQEGSWVAQATLTRISDDRQVTVKEPLFIDARTLPET